MNPGDYVQTISHHHGMKHIGTIQTVNLKGFYRIEWKASFAPDTDHYVKPIRSLGKWWTENNIEPIELTGKLIFALASLKGN